MRPVKWHLLSLCNTPDHGDRQEKPWREPSPLPQLPSPPRSPQGVIVTAGLEGQEGAIPEFEWQSSLSPTLPPIHLRTLPFLTVTQTALHPPIPHPPSDQQRAGAEAGALRQKQSWWIFSPNSSPMVWTDLPLQLPSLIRVF